MAIPSLEYINVTIMDRRSELNDLKICQLCAVDFTVAKFLLPLIDGMKNKGWKVDVICSPGKYSSKLKNAGYDFHLIRIYRNFNVIKMLVSIYKVYKIFNKQKYDIVHVHSPIGSIIGRISAKLAGIPFVIYTAHGFYFHDDMPKIKYKFYFYIEKFLSKFTDLIFTQSFEDYKTAVKFKFLSKEKIFSIGNGVDKNKFDPLIDKAIIKKYKSELNISKNQFIVGMISRLVREKGLIEFLKAAQSIFQKNSNIVFVLIGERLSSDHDKDIKKELDFAKSLMKDNLKILGEREDIRELISILDLFCLPSWREGMPRSIIEAMMMAKPVIGTDIRGSRELILHKKTGLIIPVNNKKKLEDAITFFIKHKNLCNIYGHNGRKRAEIYFNEENVIRKQLQLITKLKFGEE